MLKAFVTALHRFLCGCLPAFLVTAALHSQSSSANTMSTVSVPQFGTYEGTIDTINVGALDALSLRIPLFHAHRRGQKIDQDIALVYSDDLAHYLSTSLSYRVTGGWTLTQGEGYQNGISILETTYPCQLPNNPTEGPGSVTSAQYFYTDERGVQSTFGTLLLSTSLSYRVTGGWTLTQGEGYQNGISILETTYPCQLPNNPTEGPVECPA